MEPVDFKIFEPFFKPELRASGEKLFLNKKVSISSSSDTEIHAYVEASPAIRVRFKTDDIGSDSFSATCSCAAAHRSRLCKHVWSVILAVLEKHSDFLRFKTRIEKNPLTFEVQKLENQFKLSAKERASNYRNEQYQKIRERKGAARKLASKSHVNAKRYPEGVVGAIEYFSRNGFPMSEGLSMMQIGEAKRKLSRVFHPDKGGTNQEMIELNIHCEILSRYVGENN